MSFPKMVEKYPSHHSLQDSRSFYLCGYRLNMHKSYDRSMVYIEEPEAHLFPTAQSQVIEFLASVISGNDARMLITTHSPYVLTQINILIKAGKLAKKFPEAKGAIEKVVNPRNWLKPGSTVAYAIVGRRVLQITDEDGLLVGDYWTRFPAIWNANFPA